MSAVVLIPGLWRPAPAAELLRERLRDAGLPRRLREAFDRWLLAGGKSDYLEAKVKNEAFGAVAFAAPATLYFGLWGTAGSLTDASHGGTAGEVSGGSYARVAVTNNTTNFATVTTAAKVNSTAVSWPTATADWNAAATINQLGVLDGNAGTSGDNLLVWADLTVPKAILNGDTGSLAASAFSHTED